MRATREEVLSKGEEELKIIMTRYKLKLAKKKEQLGFAK